MKYSNFDEYPHKIYATAFLVNGELADYKICNHKRNWDERTFRGASWEGEVWQHGFIDKDWALTCEYKEIIVNNDDEHNEGFDILKDWLFDNFKLYKKANLIKE